MIELRKKNLIFSLTAALTFLADQGSKFFAEDFGWRVFINPGVSFGLLSQSNFLFRTIISFLILFMLVATFSYYRKFMTAHPVFSAVFLSSSLSNLSDRVMFGGVRDFLVIPGTSLYNNLADYLIMMSVLYLVLIQYRSNYAHSDS